ncbi:MAG: glycosyltransferase, partial [Candidatus Omnitrophica bacterium]|nr:glycosyltransferase [Candidatus Omnitrophota bacterium]
LKQHGQMLDDLYPQWVHADVTVQAYAPYELPILKREVWGILQSDLKEVRQEEMLTVMRRLISLLKPVRLAPVDVVIPRESILRQFIQKNSSNNLRNIRGKTAIETQASSPGEKCYSIGELVGLYKGDVRSLQQIVPHVIVEHFIPQDPTRRNMILAGLSGENVSLSMSVTVDEVIKTARVLEQFRVMISIPDGLADKILDEALFKQVTSILYHLFQNAYKYCKKDNPETVIAIDIDYGSKSKYLTLLVRDQGIGIPQAELELVRKMNGYRAENAKRSFIYPGHRGGVGLNWVRLIVCRLSGTVTIDSTENVGTTVTVMLPNIIISASSPARGLGLNGRTEKMGQRPFSDPAASSSDSNSILDTQYARRTRGSSPSESTGQNPFVAVKIPYNPAAASSPQQSRQTNIVFFDYGRVLGTQIEDFFDETLRRLGTYSGLTDSEGWQTEKKPSFREGLHRLIIPPEEVDEGSEIIARHDLHRNPETFKRWVDLISRYLLGYGAVRPVTQDEFEEAYFGPMSANPWIQERLDDLLRVQSERGIRFGVISNFEAAGRKWMMKLFDRCYPGLIDPDLIVITGEHGTVKSDGKKIFEIALDKYRKQYGEPKYPVFIDNQVDRYIPAAKEAGMRRFLHYGFNDTTSAFRNEQFGRARMIGAEENEGGFIETLIADSLKSSSPLNNLRAQQVQSPADAKRLYQASSPQAADSSSPQYQPRASSLGFFGLIGDFFAQQTGLGNVQDFLQRLKVFEQRNSLVHALTFMMNKHLGEQAEIVTSKEVTALLRRKSTIRFGDLADDGALYLDSAQRILHEAMSTRASSEKERTVLAALKTAAESLYVVPYGKQAAHRYYVTSHAREGIPFLQINPRRYQDALIGETPQEFEDQEASSYIKGLAEEFIASSSIVPRYGSSSVSSRIFVGTHSRSLDRGRLLIPAAWRKDLASSKLYLYKGDEGYLCFGDKKPQDRIPMAAIDRNSRLHIPRALREFAGLADIAVFVGVGDRLEIWSPGRWDDFKRKALDQATSARQAELSADAADVRFPVWVSTEDGRTTIGKRPQGAEWVAHTNLLQITHPRMGKGYPRSSSSVDLKNHNSKSNCNSSSSASQRKPHKEIVEELEIIGSLIKRMARLSGVAGSGVNESLGVLRKNFSPESLNILERSIQVFYSDVQQEALAVFTKNRQHSRAMRLFEEKTQNRLSEVIKTILPFIARWGATFNCHHIRKPDNVFFIEKSIIAFMMEALKNYARPDRDTFFRGYYLDRKVEAWLANSAPAQLADKRQLQQAKATRRQELERRLSSDVVGIVLRQALDEYLPTLFVTEIEKTLSGKFSGWARRLSHHRAPSQAEIERCIVPVISAFRGIFDDVMAELRRSPLRDALGRSPTRATKNSSSSLTSVKSAVVTSVPDTHRGIPEAAPERLHLSPLSYIYMLSLPRAKRIYQEVALHRSLARRPFPGARSRLEALSGAISRRGPPRVAFSSSLSGKRILMMTNHYASPTGQALHLVALNHALSSRHKNLTTHVFYEVPRQQSDRGFVEQVGSSRIIHHRYHQYGETTKKDILARVAALMGEKRGEIIDVVRIHSPKSSLAVEASRMAAQRAIPLLVQWHEGELITDDSSRQRNLEEVISRASELVTISARGARDARKKFARDVVHIPGLRDLDIFSSDPARAGVIRKKLGCDQKPIILSPSRIVASKGIFELVKAAHRLKDMNYRFLVIILGEHLQRRYLQNIQIYMQRHGLHDVVKILNPVHSREEMRDHIDAASIVAFPTVFNEGISGVILEAHAMGKPIVTTNRGGNLEVF